MSAIDKARNPNGTYNGVKVMASLTGLSEKSIQEIAEEVKANQKKLLSCIDHEFAPAEKPMQRKRICKNCGGEADSIAVGWYERGREHEWAKVVREVKGE